MNALSPSDKEVLLRYWHAVNESIWQDTLPPMKQLALIRIGLRMTHDAYQGFTCLTCGFAWADHPTDADGNPMCRQIPRATTTVVVGP